MPFPPRWIFMLGLAGIAGGAIMFIPWWGNASSDQRHAAIAIMAVVALVLAVSEEAMHIFWWFWGSAAILGGAFFALSQISYPAIPAMPDWEMPSLAIPTKFYWYAAGILVAGAMVWAGWLIWIIQLRMNYIASLFDLAEAELNELISRARGHGGRKGRVTERYEWYDKLAKKQPAIGLFGTSRDPFPPTVSDTLIEANETEAQLKRNQGYQMTVTAMFLRMLYNASPEAVKAKIAADTRENGRAPFIAAGIKELSDEPWRLIDWVVNKRGYPMRLTLVKEGTRYTGMDVIDIITQE